MTKVGPFVIVNRDDVKSGRFGEGTTTKSLLNRAESTNLEVGLASIEPGHTGHKWHRHQGCLRIDEMPGAESKSDHQPRIGYDEVYYLIKGSGVLEWMEGDKKQEVKVKEGDAVLMDSNVPFHQLRAEKEEISLIIIMTPPLC